MLPHILFLTLSLTPSILAIPLSSSTTNTNTNLNSNTNLNINKRTPFSPRQETTPEGQTTDATLLNSLNFAPPPLPNPDSLSGGKGGNNATCPSVRPSKQCCESLDGVADDVTGELGSLVPWLSGVAVSSVLALDCTGMDDSASTDDCLQQVMCCEGAPGKSTTVETFKGKCQPYDEALKVKADEEKEKSKSAAAASASASASAGASAVHGRVSVAAATPSSSSSGRVGRL
ncbi:hypothetical protein BO70DRAFT_380246 [Aspergillus heteromorphus CBS 117.55]|uniref:Hydrophobin n=1 Tax=Aspergillus heteromorphus CBS 117.55 TaxID=1448321 RepID=A0A317W675_9EURO|nr:uncharacterized protein BO70DRAFT_380246 [Aspergillus heteromorphus CBS 117.55]PWY79650.1 hypothetical protein BO70DRAFT_380246 [Aspergillus heteromorphus CBS 117.55]